MKFIKLIVINLLGICLAFADNLPLNLTAELPESTTQLIIVKSTSKAMASVTAWQKYGATWKQAFKPIISDVGSQGISATKHEGDDKTPAGLFPLGTAFGTLPLSLNIPYRRLTADDKFIDDVNSKDYNKWVHGNTNADSYETMLREDGIYNAGIVINYNMNPIIPGKGSAIFMHIWYGPNIGTTGCVAMEESDLIKILRWLNKINHPYILIMN